MSLIRPTLSTLIERARGDFDTRLQGAASRLRHSVLDVFARMIGGVASGLYGYIANIADELMPDTAVKWLDRHASNWGILRKAATAAVATVTAAGEDGSTIPAGTELQRVDGVHYRVTAQATVASGTATLTIEAVEAGTAQAVAAGMVLTFTSPVAGVNADVAVIGLDGGGTEEEDSESLRARLLDRIRQPPQGGILNDYKQWALALPGVTRAWPFARWMGAGTVGLTFVMDGREDIFPLEGDVEAVQQALDDLRPVTAELFVFAPTARPVDYILRISPDTPAIRAAITAELADFVAREAEPGGVLYPSRVSEALSQAAGEFWHDIVFPAGPAVAEPGELHTLGTVGFVA